VKLQGKQTGVANTAACLVQIKTISKLKKKNSPNFHNKRMNFS